MPVNPLYINTERTGDVWIEDFDRGVVETLGAQIVGDDYFLMLDNVVKGYFAADYRIPELRNTEMPGVMVIFASPDDRVQAFSLPCIVIRRDSIDPAEDRWPSKNLKYQAPAPGATQVTVNYHGTEITGWTSYEEQEGAWPYDLTYMISVMAAGRKCTRDAQRMLRVLLRVWPPKAGAGLFVKDTIGDTRSYEAFSEGPIDLKEALDIVDRQAGFSTSLRVNAELDLNDPYFTKSVLDFDVNTHGLGQ
jgi:hypothetical protein